MSGPKTTPRDKAIDDLRKRVARCRKASGPDPTHLQWRDIAIIEAAFQLRGRTHHHKREAFIDEMARDMRRRGNADSLEPVTVWWAGKWLLVDGHHRMAAALKALGKDAMVPVTVLHGDIAAALTAASRLNYRVKLSMTRTERLDAAWRYATLVPEASKQLVMESTGVSEGTVSEQRRVAKALLQQWTDADFDAAAIRHPGQLSWREAQAVLHGRQSPEWDAEEALQVASEAI